MDRLHQQYFFEGFTLDLTLGCLLHGENEVKLRPKSFAVLKYLVENNERLISKDQLIQEVWVDTAVTDDSLVKCLKDIRRVLHDDAQQIIKTVPRRGYIFAAKVSENVAAAPVTTLTEETSGVQVIIEEETNGHGRLADLPTAKTIALLPERRVAGFGLFTIAIKRHPAAYATVLIAALVIAGGLLYRNLRSAGSKREPDIRSLAVLPFRSLDKKEDELLGLGLADTIITRVNQISGLTVRQSTAVRKYADQEVNPLDAGKELAVDSVLAGTMQSNNEQLRLNLTLIRTQDGVPLWSDTVLVDRSAGFRMQDEVAERVANSLRLKLRQRERDTQRPVKPEAQLSYWYAKFYSGKQTNSDNQAAIDRFEHAVAVDPDFAAAWAALARVYGERAVNWHPQEKEWGAKSFAAMNKALSLDPDLPEAHVARGTMLWRSLANEAAIQEFRRAVDSDPNSDAAHHGLANVYNHIGLLDKAQVELHIVLAINPTNTSARFRRGANLEYQCKHEEALAALADSRQFNPGLWSYQIAWALFQLGRRDEAAARVAQGLEDVPADDAGVLTSMEALLAAAAGDQRKAEEKIKKSIEIGKDFQHFHHAEYAIASAYALLNKPGRALEWLQKTADDGFPCYPLFECDSNLKNLRQDPRFLAFMSRLKQQWERYQATL